MRSFQDVLNPVISKEFRVRMRSRKTPWVISLYLAALGSIIFTFIYFETGRGGYFNPNRSRELFIILSYIQFALISFVTPGLTAGVISEEREKQTLNILLTTNLSPAKIIIGKLFSSLSFMILLVIASMPLYSIVFLFGGISPLQLVKVFGFYLIGMLSIGSVGVMYSSLIKRTGIATVTTYATIIAYTILTALIPQILRSFYYLRSGYGTTIPEWVEWSYSINPVTAMMAIFESNAIIRGLPINPYWAFIIFFSVVTIISLFAAINFLKPTRKSIIGTIINGLKRKKKHKDR